MFKQINTLFPIKLSQIINVNKWIQSWLKQIRFFELLPHLKSINSTLINPVRTWLGSLSFFFRFLFFTFQNPLPSQSHFITGLFLLLFFLNFLFPLSNPFFEFIVISFEFFKLWSEERGILSCFEFIADWFTRFKPVHLIFVFITSIEHLMVIQKSWEQILRIYRVISELCIMVTRTHKFDDQIQILWEVEIEVQKRIQSSKDDVPAKVLTISDGSFICVYIVLTFRVTKSTVKPLVTGLKEMVHAFKWVY